MDVGTIEQFRILQYIRELIRDFNLTEVKLKPVESNSLRVIDSAGNSILFKYENGEVTFSKQS
jgi:hypothetical protein